MDITEALDALAQVIAEARPRALGGGAIIDRERAMALMAEVQGSVPEEVRRAHGVLAERDALIAAAAADAEEVREHARQDAEAMVAQDEITRAAHDEAHRILAAADAEAAHKRAEIDAYVDGKLASFEGVLERTLQDVSHGRAKLAGQYEPAEGEDVQVR